MTEPQLPAKLQPGDTIRVVAPSCSRASIMEHGVPRLIDSRFAELGLKLTFGDHVDENDRFHSSAIESRVADLHAAFADPHVQGIITVIGGFNSNELLPYLDWDLIGRQPKVFCGYSDITALGNAILARTGLVTYSGPHWSSFGMRDHFEPTGRWFADAVMHDAPLTLAPAAEWTDDHWFSDQDDRRPEINAGWWPITPGTATGRIVGGNLCTLNLLQATPWMPNLEGALLFLEDDAQSDAATFARDVTSLLQASDAHGVTGLLIGRFQRASAVDRATLSEIISRQPALTGKPVLAGVDFGHTSPLLTFPIGGTATIEVGGDHASVIISRH